MSPYEAQSLAVSIVADVIAGIAVLAVIAGGVVAYMTLRAILAQLKAGQWSTLLSLEQDMASRGDKFRELATQLDDPHVKGKYYAAKESYFNSIDRLASLILNGQFPQHELKQDYHDMIKETIRAFPDDFTIGTRYRKIVKLHDKWEDGK
jgi:hypothetical protein